MKTITVKMLREAEACEDQVELFAQAFGTSARVTLKNCRKASDAGLDLDWAAGGLLSAPALKAYEEVMAPALKAYEEVRAPAQKAYEEARARAFYRAWKGNTCDT